MRTSVGESACTRTLPTMAVDDCGKTAARSMISAQRTSIATFINGGLGQPGDCLERAIIFIIMTS